LAIVRAIAERHGGGVKVDGARFTIDLPRLTDLSRTGRTTAP
jgi:signal transduction histidine kinase